MGTQGVCSGVTEEGGPAGVGQEELWFPYHPLTSQASPDSRCWSLTLQVLRTSDVVGAEKKTSLKKSCLLHVFATADVEHSTANVNLSPRCQFTSACHIFLSELCDSMLPSQSLC